MHAQQKVSNTSKDSQRGNERGRRTIPAVRNVSQDGAEDVFLSSVANLSVKESKEECAYAGINKNETQGLKRHLSLAHTHSRHVTVNHDEEGNGNQLNRRSKSLHSAGRREHYNPRNKDNRSSKEFKKVIIFQIIEGAC